MNVTSNWISFLDNRFSFDNESLDSYDDNMMYFAPSSNNNVSLNGTSASLFDLEDIFQQKNDNVTSYLNPTSSASNFLTDAFIQEITYRIIGSVVCGLVILLTLAGNIMLVMSVILFRRLRSVTNMLMASLAVADITVAALVMPYLLVYDLMRTWQFGPVFCHIWISCDVMCCTASILHLCIIAFDRFLAITNPLRYKVIMSRRRAIFLIIFAWICSSAISFVPIMLGWYSDAPTDFHSEIKECFLNVNQIYAVVSSITSFYLPSPIMVYIYAKILVIAQRQSREIAHMKRTIHQSSKLEQRRFKRHTKRVLSDTKAIKTLGIIMGAFCICWLPFFLMYVILPFCTSCSLPYEVRSGITWLGYINSFINPCIYGFLNSEFRSAFQRTLRCDFNSNHYGCKSESRSSMLNRSLHSVSSFELDSMSSSGKGRNVVL